MTTPFDDLRPYLPDEIAPAMQRIAQSKEFPTMAAYLFPDRDVEDVRRMVAAITTTEEFQHKIMATMNDEVIRRSISSFTYEGLEHINPLKGYLYVSNHRDVVLDSSLLQQILHRNGFHTTEITFGSNLMSSQLLVDIGKSNKMFTVVRGASMKDFYRHSKHLSEYIRHTVVQRNESVWIAQRNGRTKDGRDATDQGIVKMFCMSSAGNDLVQAVDELNIVPVAISYEWEPWDIGKTRELYLRQTEGHYEKQPGEDCRAMLSGLLEQKGAVNICICEPLRREELLLPAPHTSNDYIKYVATLIDSRILPNVQRTPNNYIAGDLREGSTRHANRYTKVQKAAFMQRLNMALELPFENKELIREIFLGIYGNVLCS